MQIIICIFLQKQFWSGLLVHRKERSKIHMGLKKKSALFVRPPVDKFLTLWIAVRPDAQKRAL
ncbi:hypothetical protein DXT89_16375 [Agrobacterium vitis]|uniref:Uncharacterized protein n=1 Tax=Agrobacterium vitis TaxID=373 RepID=A0A7J4X312_AGRVI|nr:hypothetical protein DXT89_16375 [Agrobacterium vitis]